MIVYLRVIILRHVIAIDVEINIQSLIRCFSEGKALKPKFSVEHACPMIRGPS